MAPRTTRQVAKKPSKDITPIRTRQRRLRNGEVLLEKAETVEDLENGIQARPARNKKAPAKFHDYLSPVKNKPNLVTSELHSPASKSTNLCKEKKAVSGRTVSSRKALADRTVNPLKSDNPKQPIYYLQQYCKLHKSPPKVTDKLAVYDFSFDPDEEPALPKKKPRKRTVKKREPKPKLVIFQDNYNRNLNKALTNLKKIVNTGQKNDKQLTSVESSVKNQLTEVDVNKNNLKKTKLRKTVTIHEPLLDNVGQQEPGLPLEECVHEPTVRPTINYSPIHSHNENLIRPTLASDTLKRPTEFFDQQSPSNNPQPGQHDQFNIQNDEEFTFDEQPIASSSFLSSPRRPNATPWRLQWEAPATKWPVNMHVKSNMTPAYDSNFSNVDVDIGSRRYPVDIEINTHHDNDIPEDKSKESNNLVQTSILSFIQEVVTKSAKKKNRSLTPAKHNSNFDNVTDLSTENSALNTQHHDHFFTPEKTDDVMKPNKVTKNNPHKAKVDKVKKKVLQNDESPGKTASQSNNNIQLADKENISQSPNKTPQKRKLRSESKTPNKSKKTDKYFGFDLDSDQENQSPNKQAAKPRVLRPRTGGVLKEVNIQNKPLRIPEILTTRQAFREEASRLFEQEKLSKQQEPTDEEFDPFDKDFDVVIDDVDPSVNLTESSETSDAELEKQDQNNDVIENPSPVLFDDVDIVHHNKAVRKSYGKGVQPADRRMSGAASVRDSDVDSDSDEELGFVQPVLRQEKARTKKRKVNKMSKKEEEEAEKWANGFNSMCEDVEGFDLVIE